MNLTKTLLSVLPAASKDETRPRLTVVHLEKTRDDVARAVATNGHWLVAATDKGAATPDVAGNLKRADAEKIVKMLGSKQDAAVLTKTGDQFAAELPGGIRFEAQAETAEFPNWEAVMPSGEAKATVGLDVEYLETICKALKAFAKAQGVKQVHVTLEVRGDCEPVAFGLKGNTGDMRGVLMPVKL